MIRFIAFQFAFLLIAAGALVLGCVTLPLRAVSFGWPEVEGVRNTIHRAARLYLRLLRFLRLLDVSVAGISNAAVPSTGLIVIANHSSLLDIVLLVSIFPHCGCVANKRLFYLSPFALIARWAKYHSNQSGSDSLALAEAELRAGRAFVVFPEGTRSRQRSESERGEPASASSALLQKPSIKRGAAALALRSQATVVATQICYTPSVLGKGYKWWKVPTECCKVRVILQTQRSFVSGKAEPWQRRRELSQEIARLLQPAGPNPEQTDFHSTGVIAWPPRS